MLDPHTTIDTRSLRVPPAVDINVITRRKATNVVQEVAPTHPANVAEHAAHQNHLKHQQALVATNTRRNKKRNPGKSYCLLKHCEDIVMLLCYCTDIP